jgi:hypothetical protein
MKCKCGSEMELWQSTKYSGVLVKRYRCFACGNEEAEILDSTRPKDVKPSEINKE